MINRPEVIKAALFDLDGVILDTESQYSEFWGLMGRRFRPDVTDFADRIKGQTLTQIFDAWFTGCEAEQAEIKRLLDAFEQQMTFKYIKGSRAYAELLRAHGVPTAIVTSSNRLKMAQVLHAHPELTQLFNRILTSEDFSASKPAPDCYILGAEVLGVQPRECVIFEDSINGLRSAHAAGGYVVGLTTTLPSDVVAPLSDITITDFSDPKLSTQPLVALTLQSTSNS